MVTELQGWVSPCTPPFLANNDTVTLKTLRKHGLDIVRWGGKRASRRASFGYLTYIVSYKNEVFALSSKGDLAL
jgi:hypothetical protein